MWTLAVFTMAVWSVDAKGIRLHLSDGMEDMLRKSEWDHQNTTLSIHGPMTLDVQSSFKLKKGQVFLESRINNNRLKNCADIKNHRPLSRDGLYTIYPTPGTNKTVVCDMTTDGGGWTVIQKRQDGNTNFLRHWKDYKKGFGYAGDEYWLGNDAIHALTKDKNQILRIDLTKFSREKAHATYSLFFVDNEANKYKLSLGRFNATKGVGDSFARSNNTYFSTIDSDNDTARGSDCAGTYKAGWWFSDCMYTNLNGLYRKPPQNDGRELTWYNWGNTFRSLKSTKMMIRPR